MPGAVSPLTEGFPHNAEVVLDQSGGRPWVVGADNSEQKGRWFLMGCLRDFYVNTSDLSAAQRMGEALTVEVDSSPGPPHRTHSIARVGLANVLRKLCKFEDALALLQVVERDEVTALGEDDLEVAKVQNMIANQLSSLRMHREAWKLLLMEVRKKVPYGKTFLDIKQIWPQDPGNCWIP